MRFLEELKTPKFPFDIDWPLKGQIFSSAYLWLQKYIFEKIQDAGFEAAEVKNFTLEVAEVKMSFFI